MEVKRSFNMPEYSFLSPLYLILIISYFLVASVVTLDIRLVQAKQMGQDFGELPPWTFIFSLLQWGLFIALFILNWKHALILFVVKFVLKVLPVLETIGNVLMSPFRPKESEIEEIGRELYESTGLDYKEVLAKLERDREKKSYSSKQIDRE